MDESSQTDTMKQKISTLVFMDLETTGLPSDVGKKNVHITEISLVAVDRNSFEDDKSLRALNKLSLCIRPRSIVSPGAMYATGLYNDILENQEEFNDSIPKLLEYFFRRLQTPICLLAHNGNRFDFPVLQAELRRLNYSLCPNILCADTLVAFRSICCALKEYGHCELEKKTEVEELHSVKTTSGGVLISEEDIDNLLSDDIESFTSVEPANFILETQEKKSSECERREIPHLEQKSAVNFEKEILVSCNEFLSPGKNEKTPPKCKIPIVTNEIVKNVRKRKIPDPVYHPKNDYKKKIQPVKRKLFSEPEALKITNITKFSLESLYNHFFHENPPKSHYAEIDCISLSKVCQKISKDFLQWIDENSVAFYNTDALW